VRRLFSTFAHGWPGVGLLVMRLVGGTAFVARSAAALDVLHRGRSTTAAAVLGIAAGLFLLAGLWTPIAGSLVAAIGIWFAFTHAEDPLASILLATIGAALALVGPGAWSIDARLFGWKRIDLHARKK
jgi:putative oxidoreductase